MQFYDDDGKLLSEYNPYGRDEQCTYHEVGVNEELVGVYGVKDKQSYFYSFGFIVRVPKM